MKIIFAMLSFKKKMEITDNKKQKRLYRPDFMIYYEYDGKTKRNKRNMIAFTKHKKLPLSLCRKLADSDTFIFTWTPEELVLIKKLIKEAGIDSIGSKRGDFKSYFLEKNIPCSTLSRTAKYYGITHCPGDNVITMSKVRQRFKVLKKLFFKVITINNENLFHSVIV